jgi:hypothetical protein
VSTEELATITHLPTSLILEILDAGLFGPSVEMVQGKPMYAPEAIEVVKNIGELAGEVQAQRCSPFAAWFLLRYGLKPEPSLR